MYSLIIVEPLSFCYVWVSFASYFVALVCIPSGIVIVFLLEFNIIPLLRLIQQLHGGPHCVQGKSSALAANYR